MTRPHQPLNDPSPNPEVGPAKTLMGQHRRNQIATWIQQQGVARVGELAAHFDVSEVTIRNDLVRLEKHGLIVREHGGAIARSESRTITSLLRVDERATLHLEEKRRIGHAAAQLIAPGDTVIFDAGTTVLEAARASSHITPLTVVTNALNSALEMSAHSEAHVILLGGTIGREAASTVGAQTEKNLGEFVAQKLFLGTQAFDTEHGLTDTTMEIAQVKRAMIRAARQVILLTDSSKWGRSGFIKVAPLTDLDTVITDTGLPTEARAALERLGIELVLV